MGELHPRRCAARLILAGLVAFGHAPVRADRPSAEADLAAFRRDPQCGSKAAMEALGEFFRVQAENIVAVGQTAGRVADAAGKAAPAASEAAAALAELGRMAADVAKAGPDAEKHAAALAKAIRDLEKDAGAMASLDRGVLAADGGALETSVGGFAKSCAGCASAMAAAVTDLGSGSAAARGPGALAAGSCTRPLEDASKIGERFATIQRFVGATAVVGLSIRKLVPDLVATTEALTRLGRALGKDARAGLRRIEGCLNRSIDAITDAGRTYDGDVGPRVAKLSPSLLEQLADNTDRLSACYVRLQDIAGQKTRRPTPIRFDGTLAVPSGLALERPIAKVHLELAP